jgi:hypothetical protein
MLAGLAMAAAAPLALAAHSVTLVQDQQSPDSLAAKYRVEFAVPDAPAFTLLGTDQSQIVRPVSVREFAVAVSDFVGGGAGFTIPRAFAVEVSPGLLIGGKRLSLAAYQRNATLYRLRVSIATHSPASGGGPTEIAFGIRVNLVDESDLRTNVAYVDSATAIADSINQIYEAARERVGPPPTPIVLTEDELARVGRIEAGLKDAWARKKWNARMLEIAGGIRASAADSTGQDLHSQEGAGWATFATGFGRWGQLLVGCKFATSRDSLSSLFHTAGSLSMRFYVGTNRIKIFLETGGLWQQGNDSWLLNSGGESLLFGKTWVSFAAGLDNAGGGKTTLRTSLAIKLGGFEL